jgi:two-component system phosphate regulon response regulator PhoB
VTSLLVVYPDPAVLRRVEQALGPLGHPITVAADGMEALSRIEQRLPSLVITGLSLPRADGVTIIKALRARPGSAGVPVIVMSSRRDASASMEALAVGARYFLPLPLIDEDLRDKVEALLLEHRPG